ncbi:hypothetical protein [Nocardia cyriacigeorgica]|uniref:Uncharacterized protein n=1 Tax=Nocardia cyriacigeorgica TaxID=135487 RepID=A0A5R8NFQ1_9NOCA|nr:hypothetical protein [Nocardia cyriacigeorgica]TLF74489.1 hypothetical protein FEK34_24320 [Nocardia cyriacigeorgica]
MSIDIPGMPPTPPPDPGQGAHGSQPLWARYDDLQFFDQMIFATAAADAAGLTNAADHLEHYLANTGTDWTLDPDRIMHDEPALKLHFDNLITVGVWDIARRIGSVTTGQSISASFQLAWKEYVFRDRDWYLAIGAVETTACGAVKVEKLNSDGESYSIDLRYQCHLYDRYNWDGDKQTEIAGFTWTDRELGALHTAGLAKEFDMIGSSTIKHYKGDLPPVGDLNLPAPSGTGTPR